MAELKPTPLPIDSALLCRIRVMATGDVLRVAQLHRAAMGHSLWAELGEPFLAELYRSLLGDPEFIGFVYQEEGVVRGFIAGTGDGPGLLRRLLRRRGSRLALAALPGALARPGVAWQLAQTLLYFRRSAPPGATIRAESLFCSFEPELRGRRVSGLINKILFDDLAARGHRQLKVTTEADNEGAVRQLTTWGFEQLGEFTFYGKRMLIWCLDLVNNPRVEARPWRYHLLHCASATATGGDPSPKEQR